MTDLDAYDDEEDERLIPEGSRLRVAGWFALWSVVSLGLWYLIKAVFS